MTLNEQLIEAAKAGDIKKMRERKEAGANDFEGALDNARNHGSRREVIDLLAAWYFLK